jgi:hypothetical protein
VGVGGSLDGLLRLYRGHPGGHSGWGGHDHGLGHGLGPGMEGRCVAAIVLCESAS